MPLDSIIPAEAAPRSLARRDWCETLCRPFVLAALQRIHGGRVTLHENGRTHAFGRSAPDGLEAALEVHAPGFWRQVALGGVLGAGEAYVRGLWSSDNLTAFIRIMIRSQASFAAANRLWRWTLGPSQRLGHWLRDNTLAGSRRNISAHYDLGNDFYQLMLDDTLMYSAAIFEHPQQSLHAAQVGRLDRMARKLQLGPGDHLLEIGTGWGGLALHAAARYGCRVTTTTISREQFEFARQRVRRAGLAERVTVLCEDYRELRGTYDKLISIEMVEAVGDRWLDTFFARCARLLRPDGPMLLQSITVAEPYYETARRSVDFIKKYVFPGSCIPSLGSLLAAAGRAGDFRLLGLDEIGLDYAETLRRWRANFLARLDDVRRLGFGRSFERMWEYYLCYCEAGFEERVIGDVQLLLGRPGCRVVSAR